MRKRTILFVDDEEKIRKYFHRIFRRDFEVIVAGDGSEGLRTFTERRDEIGIVVTDQMMPNVTGLEMLAQIEQVDPAVIRILSTAYADSDLVAAAAGSGLIDHLVVKPWEIEVVSEIFVQASAQFETKRGRGDVAMEPKEQGGEIPESSRSRGL